MAHWSDSELKRNRRSQDSVLAERHRQWDLQAQDNTPKHHRAHFAVVGEGTRSAQERYLNGYTAIRWDQ
jgi:hypothetical protein